MQTINEVKEGWEQRFDKKYCTAQKQTDCQPDKVLVGILLGDVKSFIQEVIQQERERIWGELENRLEHYAHLEHERWSKWQEYMFECAVVSGDDNLGIRTLAFPTGQYENWKRQIDTPYAELSEKEKESDRKEVRPYLSDTKDIIFNQKK